MNPRTLTLDIPPGDDGAIVTAGAMSVVAFHASVTLRDRFRAMLGGRVSAIDAVPYIYEAAVRGITFERDPERVELVRHPRLVFETLDRGERFRGDCDDGATWIAAAIMAAGFDAGLALVSQAPDRPYHHVYAVVGINHPNERGGVATRWLALDAQERDYLEHRAYARSMVVPCAYVVSMLSTGYSNHQGNII